ncbi:MAG: SurA N-terminal domain-containing protein [Deltaproteobacteria bacterium]|nr:SurA N-terminal domain-containing protein [Deltaproteobacteria bacterium]MBW1874104.1 SurA N-terminal domain-containing protein [Deltaproteobacteria bacterium]MBW2209485.1 SurA N-terminal domain-containing protein [Deltaproteobacteria bacterium]MBW2213831.1 SurA N-terminal domain-containing protein [Deltaproteobacteria bacterium]MBW2378026.1 SurA N-terminal domain-containing protein [Deltaproteobacteria bacterium]
MTRLAVATLLLVLTANSASADVVERVVATVNDRAVFLSDLRKRAVPFLPQVADASTETERMARLKDLYEELLDHLIDEQLIRQLASGSGIRVTDADVDNAIENLRLQNNMTEAQFQEALDAQGFTQSQYRKDLKRQLIRLKVMNERVRSRVNVTEEEVRARYEQRAREEGSELRFQVSNVVVPVGEGASAIQVAAKRQEAETLRASLTPENFDARAPQLGGGDLGWLTQGDLPEELGRALLPLNAGEISSPVRGKSGFHIFFLRDRQVGAGFPSYEEMKQELFREMMDAAMVRQENIFLDEMRRKAVINRML